MTDLKEEAKRIFLRTLESITIEARLRDVIRLTGDTLSINGETLHLSNHTEIRLIGIGKASLEMGRIVEAILGERLTHGLLVASQKSRQALRSEVVVAGHPTPNENSVVAAEKILQLIETSTDDALFIFLLSGGGSALVELPKANLSLDDLRRYNRTLVNCGASIREINLVRKYLSRIKGGGLARALNGRRALAFYISDVNPGDLGSIASGPLIEDEPQSSEILRIVEAYNLLEAFPTPVVELLRRLQTDPTGDSNGQIPSRITHVLLLDNSEAVRVASSIARQSGHQVQVIGDQIDGDYHQVADVLLAALLAMQKQFPTDSVCVLSGGEVSCAVNGQGIGGRNQEFVLYSAAKLSELVPNGETAVLSCGTDGIDGVSPAAGAVAGGDTIKLAEKLGLNVEAYFQTNDSHSFLKQAGGLLLTGPSGNNVRDIRVLLAKPKST